MPMFGAFPNGVSAVYGQQNYPPKEAIMADAQTNAATLASNPQYIWTKNHGAWAGATHGPTVAQYIADQKQARWNQMFPYLTKALSGDVGVGANQGTLPTISSGPIWDPEQIQQQVNASRANTDASTASRGREVQSSLSGRGFGANSPLLSALQGSFQRQGMAQNADSERQIRFGAGQANAEQLLKGQTARSDQELGWRKIQADQFSAAISALSQALSGLG